MASIKKRSDNTYKITVSCGYDSYNKKIRKYKTVTLPEAMTDKQKEKELLRLSILFEEEVQKGMYFESQHYKLQDFISKWLEERKQGLENKTYYRYKEILDGRVKEALGHLRLTQIKPLHLLEFYKILQQDGIRKDNKPGKLSNRTILHYHRVLSALFSDAVRWELMKENPCTKVQPPKIIKSGISSFEETDISELLQALKTESIKIQTLIILALVTGCRRGELVALQWDNIDLTKKQIIIAQSAEYTSATGIQVKSPKTTASTRKIIIPDTTVKLLKRYRKFQLRQKIKLGNLWQEEQKEREGLNWKDSNWLFTTWNGYIMHPDSLTDMFKKFLRRHNLADIRFHDLRHISCTMLIHAGMNVKAIATRMGHANPNVTLAVYSHAFQTADQQAADILETLIDIYL